MHICTLFNITKSILWEKSIKQFMLEPKISTHKLGQSVQSLSASLFFSSWGCKQAQLPVRMDRCCVVILQSFLVTLLVLSLSYMFAAHLFYFIAHCGLNAHINVVSCTKYTKKSKTVKKKKSKFQVTNNLVKTDTEAKIFYYILLMYLLKCTSTRVPFFYLWLQ